MFNSFLTSLAKIIAVPLVSILTFAGYDISSSVPLQQKLETLNSKVQTLDSNAKLGAVNYVSGGGTYRLQSSIGTTDTTIKLSSFKEPVSGTPYTMAYLNSALEYGTLDPQNPSRSEFISFTGITQNADGTATLTGVVRGLARSYPYTTSSTFKQTHSGQSIFILSNTPQVYNDIYTYINNATYAGTVDMTAVVKGIGEKSTANEAASHAADGSGNTTAPLVLTSSIASSTRTANTAQVVISSSTDGYIDNSYISSSTLQTPPVGSIIPYSSTTTIPAGFLQTNGQAVSRTSTYGNLFNVIGVNHGSGDGSTTFNIPAQSSTFGGIQLDNTQSKSQPSGTSATWAHTINASNEILIVGFQSGSGTTVPTATYGGVTMIAIQSQLSAGSTGVIIWYYLLNPTVGTANVVISSFDSSVNIGVSASYLNMPGAILSSYASGGNSSNNYIAFTSTSTAPAFALALFRGVSSSVPIIERGNIRQNVVNSNISLTLVDFSLDDTASTSATFSTLAQQYGFIAGFKPFIGHGKFTVPSLIKY